MPRAGALPMPPEVTVPALVTWRGLGEGVGGVEDEGEAQGLRSGVLAVRG